MKPFDISKRKWIEVDNYDDLAIGDKLFSSLDSKLKDKKLFFIDLDGTIFLGNKLIEGSIDFINKLNSQNISFYFLSK